MDQIVGTAVLFKPEYCRDEVYHLYFISQRENGKVFCNQISFLINEEDREKVKAHNPDRPLWSYRMEGDMLHCCPSINCELMNWHNSHNWSVKFVWHTDKKYVYQHLRELNAKLLEEHEE